MTLKSRLERLSNFKFCPDCGTDWQAQQQENLARKKRIEIGLQRLIEEVEKSSDPQDALAYIKRIVPELWFWSSYQENVIVGWNKGEIPEGYCLCGRDLLSADTRKEEIISRLLVEGQVRYGMDEVEAKHEARARLENARKLVRERERDDSLCEK
jgi:hypothetical protein